MTEVPDGTACVCALGLPDLSDQELERKLLSHLDRLQMSCVPIPPRSEVVVIEVPPLPRLTDANVGAQPTTCRSRHAYSGRRVAVREIRAWALAHSLDRIIVIIQ